MRRKPNIRNFSENTNAIGEISLRGYIGESNKDYVDWYGDTIEAWGAGTVKELEDEIKALNVQEIRLLITSEGGSVFDAITIADILNRHSAKIVAIVQGYAFSAATILICKCADEIQMASNAYMMIHNAEGGVCGDLKTIRNYADMLESVGSTIAGIYASRGGPGAARFQEMMDAGDCYLTGAECVSLKLADTLTDEVALSNSIRDVTPIKNAKTLERMPAAVRALFDSPTPSPAPITPPTNPPDNEMKPEEITALVKSTVEETVKPLNEKITGLENTNTEQAGKITALETENKRLSDLHKNGVPAAAAGAEPIKGAGGGDGKDDKVMNRADWSKLSPKARADFFANGGKLTD